MASGLDIFSKFFDDLPGDRKEPMTKLYEVISSNIPEGFEEEMKSMINWVVPYSIYPDGYHCPPHQPLPFISIANQKNFIGLYHFGMYATPDISRWFIKEYPKYSKYKLDMGKSCVRFKKMNDIPYALIGELCTKLSVQRWVEIYESQIKNK